jgi:hypothetical protein
MLGQDTWLFLSCCFLPTFLRLSQFHRRNGNGIRAGFSSDTFTDFISLHLTLFLRDCVRTTVSRLSVFRHPWLECYRDYNRTIQAVWRFTRHEDSDCEKGEDLVLLATISVSDQRHPHCENNSFLDPLPPSPPPPPKASSVAALHLHVENFVTQYTHIHLTTTTTSITSLTPGVMCTAPPLASVQCFPQLLCFSGERSSNLCSIHPTIHQVSKSAIPAPSYPTSSCTHTTTIFLVTDSICISFQKSSSFLQGREMQRWFWSMFSSWRYFSLKVKLVPMEACLTFLCHFMKGDKLKPWESYGFLLLSFVQISQWIKTWYD